MEVRKFFCKNSNCSKKTFAEQPGNEVFRYRRRTRRCETAVIRQGLSVSSGMASRLLSLSGIVLSRSTILRDLHRLRPSTYEDVEEIGIDDWAWRKGISYGTIVIDLRRKCPIDLLGKREESSFRSWMENHNEVSLVSRDRSTAYSSAIGSIDRPITEIADKFHLIKKMSDRFTKLIGEHYSDYRNAIRESQAVKEEIMYNELESWIKRFDLCQ
ncbi:MAG: transposase [Fermentimonas sp.]|nr:transposase [Fermentimonas sp.]